MNIANLLVRAGRSLAERPAVASGADTIMDYGQLARRSACIAGALRERFALAPGARVAVVMRNNPAYVEALFAIWQAGLVAVPVNAKLAGAEIAYIIDHSGAALCFTTPGLTHIVAAAQAAVVPSVIDVTTADYSELAAAAPVPAAQCKADDPAWLFYTSGTTGRPKGAILTHRNLAAMTQGYFTDVDTIGPGDAIVHAAPMSHGSGLYILPHVAAGALQIIPESGGFDPAEIFALLQSHCGVSLFAAPSMIKRMVDAAAAGPPDTSNLKTVVYGGGPMYLADIKAAMTVFGARFAQIYGQGESPMTITAMPKWMHADKGHPRHERRLASVGIAQSMLEVRVIGGDGKSLPPDEPGEIVVRGDAVMQGYWRNPEATARTLIDGWLYTGDIGSLDRDGFLTLRDRSKDVIISGGTNVYPREVEEALLQHDAVAEVSVVGRHDTEWGEAVVAFVVCSGKSEPAAVELDAFCLERIARFKRPREYHFVDALPKNAYGKVLKTVLRDRIAG